MSMTAKCAHCGATVDGQTHLRVHVAGGRLNIVSEHFNFCGGDADCRATWWHAAGDRDLIEVLREEEDRESGRLHDGDRDLSVVVLHEGQRYPDGSMDVVRVTDALGQHIALLHGVDVERHSFADPAEMNAWWRASSDGL